MSQVGDLKIVHWRGYHSPELLGLIASAWEGEHLLTVGSPQTPDFDLSQISNFTSSVNRPILAVSTSGTTGKPRWVFYSKENIESSLSSIMSLFDQTQIETIFCYPQPFHTFGLTLGYVLSLRNGWKLVTPDGKYSRAAHIKRMQLQEQKVLTLGTPVHFWDLSKFLQDSDQSLMPSYSSIVGGAPVPVKLWHLMRDRLKISQPSIGYGCTEASPGITHLPPGEEPLHDFEVGYPLSGVEMEVIEGLGVEFSGQNLCQAYEDIIFPKSMLIKDHLEVDLRGCYRFVKRHDLVINCGGQKISIEAVEKAIFEQLAVEALAVSLPDERLGEDLGLLVKSQDVSLAKKICDLVASEFGRRLSPENIRAVQHFPLNVNGKLDRQAASRTLSLKLPCLVSQFAEWTPHRAPMVWVDRLLSVNADEGLCEVTLKSDGLYMTDSKLRLTSLVEFVAQSFAYVRAAQSAFGFGNQAQKPKRAFLVGARETQFKLIEGDLRAVAGQKLFIRIFDVRSLLPFVVYSAEVLSEGGELLMTTKMKLFHE